MMTLLSLLSALLFTPAHAEHELTLPANELGQVMVLMYHQIKSPESFISAKDVYSTTSTLFRENLEKLYEQGYFSVNATSLVDGTFNVPAGKTPVVITFDDGAPGQFAKSAEGWDPNCAVGIMNQFYEKHPDFGRAGTFFLNELSEAKHPDVKEMLTEMVSLGYELGNHTVSHPQLDKLNEDQVRKETANLQAWIQSIIPGYPVRTMALPFGIYPKNIEWVSEGDVSGVKYHNEALFKVGAEPSVSPYSKNFKPLHISRVRASDPVWFNKYIDLFTQNPALRFISDGDPGLVTVPEAKKDQLRRDLPSGLRVYVRP